MSRPSTSEAAKRKAEEKEKLSKIQKVTSFFKVQSPLSTTLASGHLQRAKDNPPECMGESAELVSTSMLSVADPQTVPGMSSAAPSTDPALWNPINDELRSYWSQKGPLPCQNLDSDFCKSVRVYQFGDKTEKVSLTEAAFTKILPNGESVALSWLLYSPSQGSVYCFVCRLFSDVDSAFSTTGFNDWKNVASSLSEHGLDSEHLKSSLEYCRLIPKPVQIDPELQEHLKYEQHYWRNVLEKSVQVVKFLASCGLEFQGHNQIIGSQSNRNLGILDLVSRFEPYLEEHLRDYGNNVEGNFPDLSAAIGKELTTLMQERVYSTIISELKKAKYYSLSVDSTPEVCHVDHVTFTVRYVKDQEPKERFLQCIPIHGQGAEYLADTVIKVLQRAGIALSDCRSLSYDNAPHLAEHYSCLEAKLKEINEFAVYVPRVGRSLNLVAVQAAECSIQVASYFDFVQCLYTFFASSTHRWNMLLSAVGPGHNRVERLLDIRWAADADAVCSLCDCFGTIKATLNSITSDGSQACETRHAALIISNKMNNLETVFFTILWNDILKLVSEANKNIQKEVNLCIAANIIEPLTSFIENLGSQFNEYELKAKLRAPGTEYSDEIESMRQQHCRLASFEGDASDTTAQGKQHLNKVFLQTIRSMFSVFTRLKKAYKDIFTQFGFIMKLVDMKSREIKKQCEKLASHYHRDLGKRSLNSECQYLKKSAFTENKMMSLSCLYKKIKNANLDPLFPNVQIALRMFLSMMVTNCSGEELPIKSKVIKKQLRNCMLKPRSNPLMLLNIESDMLQDIDFTDLIHDLAARKSRVCLGIE